MREWMLEYANARGTEIRVDRAAGVVRGVKVLGLVSRNGRRYLPEALRGAAALYEGAKVNVNHPKGNPAGPRDYQDRIGALKGVVVRPGEGLFADFHFNPKHALAEQLAWDAEHAPQNVGFSHHVEARTRCRQGEVVVEEILKVQSVDLVADPATTRGLFENATGDHSPRDGTAGETSPAEHFAKDDAATDRARNDSALNDSALNDSVMNDGAMNDRAETYGAAHRALDEVLRGRDAPSQRADERIAALEAKVLALEAELAQRDRRALVAQLLAEHGLPGPDAREGWARTAVSEAFLEGLLRAPDEATLRRMVAERARLLTEASGWEPIRLGRGRPIAKDQREAEASLLSVANAADFVRAIS